MKLIQLHNMLKLIFVITLFILPLKLLAIEVADLYQARVAVESQSIEVRSAAIKRAMAAVLLKVGGDESVLENKIVNQQIQSYNQYLVQYRYERDKQQRYLVVLFNEDKINQLFQQANLALWGRLRPQILVWLIQEDKLERKILSDTTSSNLSAKISTFSTERGLPLLLPLMDLDDNLSVDVTGLWGRFASEARQASARYFVDASLIIRVSNSSLLSQKYDDEREACEGVLCQEKNYYAIDWSLISEQQVFGQKYEGEDLNALLTSVLLEVAGVVYKRYASSTDLNNELTIDVANIDSLATSVAVHRFLTELSVVESVTLVSAEQQVRQFKLKLLGSKKALLASLKLNDHLQQYIDPLVGEEPDANPIFYWRAQ